MGIRMVTTVERRLRKVDSVVDTQNFLTFPCALLVWDLLSTHGNCKKNIAKAYFTAVLVP